LADQRAKVPVGFATQPPKAAGIGAHANLIGDVVVAQISGKDLDREDVAVVPMSRIDLVPIRPGDASDLQ